MEHVTGSAPFGFSPLPLGFLAILALVELGKWLFFGRRALRPRLPIAGWRHPPAVQRIERLASRWTVRRKARLGSTR